MHWTLLISIANNCDLVRKQKLCSALRQGQEGGNTMVERWQKAITVVIAGLILSLVGITTAHASNAHQIASDTDLMQLARGEHQGQVMPVATVDDDYGQPITSWTAYSYVYVGGVSEEHFPVSQAESSQKILVFGLFQPLRENGAQVTSIPEAIRLMDQQGYRPATLRELLAFRAARYPYVQLHQLWQLFKEAKVVALGSRWVDQKHPKGMPIGIELVEWSDEPGPQLHLMPWGGYSDHSLILAVKKQ